MQAASTLGTAQVPELACSSPGCRGHARHGKPVCVRHLEGMPYVAELLAKLAGQREELARVRAEDDFLPDPRGINAEEILRALRFGPRTIELLAVETQLERIDVARYVEALLRAGRVLRERSTGGSWQVTLVASVGGQRVLA